jgi:hypothetical protein
MSPTSCHCSTPHRLLFPVMFVLSPGGRHSNTNRISSQVALAKLVLLSLEPTFATQGFFSSEGPKINSNQRWK